MRRPWLVALLVAGLLATAQGRPGRPWAQALPRFRWLATQGACAPVRFQSPPCPRGFRLHFLVEDPPAERGHGLGPMLTLTPGLPRSTPLCGRGLATHQDLFLREEGRDVVALLNHLGNNILDLTTSQARCLSFADAQREAARTGEPY